MSKALAGSSTPVTPAWYREVLGQYPTGVAVVTAIDADQAPVGLAVGTFTSVSLEAPLVAHGGGRALLHQQPGSRSGGRVPDLRQQGDGQVPRSPLARRRLGLADHRGFRRLGRLRLRERARRRRLRA